MPAIKIAGFTGISPRTGPTLLADNQAQTANNVKLQSGELRPWRKPVFTASAAVANAMTIYKLIGTAGATAWLSWSTDVDIVTSPNADVADFRFYYTGSGTPKKSNWAMSTVGTGVMPYASYEMGLPAPVAAPALSASGGSIPLETRAYIYTYVSTFGVVKEESAPSPAQLVTCNSAGSTVVVSGFSAPPAGLYNVTAIRIYRSVTGTTSSTYLQVAEIPIATSTYSDTVAVVSLGAVLSSLYYTPPPSGLQGLVSMPGGVMAGFVGNQIWFSEPYLPHAWPVSYMLTTEFPIVGLGVYNSTLFVGTTKNPYLISGSSPSVMSQEKMSMTQACVSKRSIAFDQHGVLYASPYGMVAVGPGAFSGARGAQDISTAALVTIDEWKPLVPSSLVGTIYGNYYMGFYNTGIVRNGLVLGRNGDTPPMTSFNFPATSVFVERGTGNLYACSATDNGIYQLDADPVNNTVYEWKSKKFVMPTPVSFSVAQVNIDMTYLLSNSSLIAAVAAVVAANLATFTSGQSTGRMGDNLNAVMPNVNMINGSNLSTPLSQTDICNVQMTIFADGVQVFSAAITSLDLVRLPAGFKAYGWEILLTGNSPVRSIALSTTIAELKT